VEVTDETRRVPANPDPSQAALDACRSELQICRDELRVAERELGVARERYRELYDLAPVACLSLSASGCILEANKAAGILFRARPDALLGLRFLRFVAQEHSDIFEKHRVAVTTRGKRTDCTLDVVLPDGERRELRLDSIRTGEASPAWRTAITDVTDVCRLERELRQAQELEAMGMLASGAAHDFGNLLMALIGRAELALASLEEASPARELIEELRLGALHGRVVVDELRGLVRPVEPVRGRVEMDASVRASISTLQQVAGPAIVVDATLQAAAACVEVQPGELDQILLNLTTNAKYAMPHGGALRISSRIVEPDTLGASVRSELGPQPCVRLTIADSGTGMPDEVRARAFEPFFTTKPVGTGTGLGLWMVYGVVKRTGGHCELHSEAGRGTTVDMHWPRAGSDHVKVDAAAALPAHGSGHPIHVLLIEDDRLVRFTVRRYLQAAGYGVVEACSGHEAIELLRKPAARVDAIVSDVILPGARGPEVVSTARSIRPDVPVLFISALPAEMLIARGWLSRDARMLAKPFTAEQLCEAVGQLTATRVDATAG